MANNDSKQFSQREVLVHPRLIENRWSKDKKPLYHYCGWHHLSVELTDYSFVSRHQFLDTNFRYEKSTTEEDLWRRAFANYNGLSDDDKNQLLWQHLQDIETQKERHILSLIGVGKIEGSRNIRVVSLDTRDKIDTVNYDKTFDAIRHVQIKEVDDDRVGVLMHWTEELRRLDNDGGGTEDYLVAEIYVKRGSLRAVQREINRNSGDVPIRLDLRAYLFQDEVEAALAEPYHRQTYEMLHDQNASVILVSLVVGSLLDKQNDTVQAENGLKAEQPNHLIAKTGSVEGSGVSDAVSKLSKNLRGIKIALWIIAFVLALLLLRHMS